ncbi:zwei Ig domain protein zig-8-like [Centruroides sculpturatus]|uniref:zwei Ig domain protein zig-8-like n=1 Tax=Centruroides sculpturatus TaxID=218467 RepID=UPI000C6DB5C1|nr:zwei Ig domain protein zig-8-like [Centruroides sculpturatus]
MGQEKLPRIVPPIPKHIQFRSRTHVVEPSSIRNVTAQVGQTAYLHCIVGSLGDRTVSWIRLRDFHLLTVALYTYTSDDRFHPIHRQYSNDWMLQIKFSQPSDEGLYECQISADPSISHYVYLSIVVPKAKIPGATDLYVKAGSDINLTCIISQSPEPPSFVFWYHDNRMINYDSSKGDTTVQKASGDTAISRLTIRDAQPEDSGNYTCGPSNADATSILVHVLRGTKENLKLELINLNLFICSFLFFSLFFFLVPKAKIPGATDLYVKAGSDINLTCIISQSPEPPSFVFWYHDNRMINYDSSKGDTTVQKASGDTAISRLTIRDAQPEDSGNYTCGPSNADATSILVHVLRGEKQAAVQNDAGSPPISAAMCSGSRHVVLFLISFILLSFWR